MCAPLELLLGLCLRIGYTRRCYELRSLYEIFDILFFARHTSPWTGKWLIINASGPAPPPASQEEDNVLGCWWWPPRADDVGNTPGRRELFYRNSRNPAAAAPRGQYPIPTQSATSHRFDHSQICFVPALLCYYLVISVFI